MEDYESLVENFQRNDDWFGQCDLHSKRAYEFYCVYCGEPFCAMCIIENQSTDKHFQHEVVELHEAYSTSLKMLKARNREVEGKKVSLKQ